MQDLVLDKKSVDRLMSQSEEIPISVLSNNPFGKTFSLILKGEIINLKSTEGEITFLDKKKYNKSIRDLSKSFLIHAIEDVKNSSNNPYEINNLGLEYLKSNELEKSQTCFESAIKLKTNFKAAKLNLALVKRLSGNYEEALKIYEELSNEYKNDSTILNNIGTIHFFQKNLDKSESIFEQLWNSGYKTIEEGNKLAVIKILKGKFQKAVSILRDCQRIDTNNATIYNNLGVSYLGVYSFQKAITAFQTAIKLAPNHKNAISNLSKLLFQRGKQDEAINLIEESLENNFSKNLSELLAEFYINIGNYNKALRILKKILLIEKQNEANSSHEIARLSNNIGVIYHHLGDFQIAEKIYEEAISLSNYESLIPLLNNIDLCFQINKLTEAKAYIDLLKEHFPNNKSFLYYEGVYFLRKEKNAEAINLFEELLEIDKHNESAYCALSYIYTEIQYNYNYSLKLLEKAILLLPDNENILNNVAYTLLMLDNVTEAKNILEKVKNITYNPFIIATKGLCKIKENELEEGRRLYNEAARIAQDITLKEHIMQKKELELAKQFLKNQNADKAIECLSKITFAKSLNSVYKKQALLLLDNIKKSS